MTPEPEMSPEEVLRVKLEVLRAEHRDLDDAIQALEGQGRADQFTLKRLKKQKLALKDRISRIEDQLDTGHHCISRARGYSAASAAGVTA